MTVVPKPKVLLLGQVEHPTAQKEWAALAPLGELVKPKSDNRADFIEECKRGELDGVVVIYRTFDSVDITGRIDEEIVEALPQSVRFICHNGAGYDQVSVSPCTARQIHVSNVPTAVDDATADTAVFLIIGCLRNFSVGIGSLRAGQWRGNPLPPLGHDPEGKTLGILGMGGIGRNLAKKMVGFGMRIVYHNRRKLGEKEACGAKYVSFDELLQSDVISLNLPLNPNTRHTISTPEFKKMKPGTIIINTARGAVMDEAALVEALDSGIVSSAGLDVFEKEPEVHPGLVDNPKVLLLPHMGTWTHETQEAMERWCISNVRVALQEGRLRSRVPEQEGMGYDVEKARVNGVNGIHGHE